MNQHITASSPVASLGMKQRVGYICYGLDRPLSGIGRYAVELARAMQAHPDAPDMLLMNPFSDDLNPLHDAFRAVRLRGRLLPAFMTLAPVQLAIAARQHSLSIVHDPTGISPFAASGWPAKARRVVTIHDMIPFVHPETHARLTNVLFQHYIPRTLRRVDAVVTVSEASKRDILRFYPIASDAVHVIHNGISHCFRPRSESEISAVRHRYKLPERYILSVGALQQRKNLATLFRAFRQILQRGFDRHLVIVGREAWKTDDTFAALHELGLEAKVSFTGYVADEDLPAVYSGAEVFVFPSLYEGFGLPPLEAMACGTPVIASSASSLPEVVGNAGLLIDPLDFGGFANAIEAVLTNRELAARLADLGPTRASMFTWERAATAHLDLYRRLNGYSYG